jgi:hypothetical protein
MPGNSPINVHGINLSLQDDDDVQGYELGIFDSYSPDPPETFRLTVTFSSDWDTRVLNKPEIILECKLLENIEIMNEPKNAAIVKKLVSDRPVGWGANHDKPPNLGDNGDKGGKGDNDALSTGAVVGIVIGVLVVAAVVAVCLWLFVLKKGDGGSGGGGAA